MILALCFAYLLSHLLVYALVLRHSVGFRSEKGIFLFHFVSALLVTVMAAGYALFEPTPASFGWAGVVLIVSLHGIYSLSFLELWSLAQGGYSLSILASINAHASGTQPDFSKLERIGKMKLEDRIRSLEKLGLIKVQGAEIVLTGRGSVAAAAMHGLLAWVGRATD
jgi:hypothetical protein